jgi:hypothetical protein
VITLLFSEDLNLRESIRVIDHLELTRCQQKTLAALMLFFHGIDLASISLVHVLGDLRQYFTGP